MNLGRSIAKTVVNNTKSFSYSRLLAYPKIVQCNVCQWQGRHFTNTIWHKQSKCPKCGSGIRQRLFFAALQHLEDFSVETLLTHKKVLHFAPEPLISEYLRPRVQAYSTADFIRTDCDFKLDMSHMPEVEDSRFEIVIAFDVLEHVPDYASALKELYRVLSPQGWGIFTVPQKDHLPTTYEDPSIVTPAARRKAFGQADHLRVFGDDFPQILERAGFTVRTVSEKSFAEDLRQKAVLFPPVLSDNPLATNYRKVFFCYKPS